MQSTKRRYVHSENSYVFTAVDDVEVKVEAEMKEHRMNQSISTKEQFQLLKCSVRVHAHTYCMIQFEVHRHVIAMIHTYFTIQCCQITTMLLFIALIYQYSYTSILWKHCLCTAIPNLGSRKRTLKKFFGTNFLCYNFIFNMYS